MRILYLENFAKLEIEDDKYENLPIKSLDNKIYKQITLNDKTLILAPTDNFMCINKTWIEGEKKESEED